MYDYVMFLLARFYLQLRYFKALLNENFKNTRNIDKWDTKTSV